MKRTVVPELRPGDVKARSTLFIIQAKNYSEWLSSKDELAYQNSPLLGIATYMWHNTPPIKNKVIFK